MSYESAWPEVAQAAKENRRELVLSHPDVSQRIALNGLDRGVFTLQNLNYLAIHDTCLEVIPDEIGELENLMTLAVHSNKLLTIPESIASLTKLRVLDCSRNQLEKLPQALSRLPQLTTINFSSNNLTELPTQIANTKLSTVDLSNNKFESFPDLCHQELVLLAEIKVNGNKIQELPAAVASLPSLKLLDLSNNAIKGKKQFFFVSQDSFNQ